MSSLWQDLRYAVRMLKRSPGFTTIAVLTLALGIGANTAIFSVVNAVLLRPLPFPDSSRLVLLYEGIPKLGFPKIGFCPPDLKFYEQSQTSFQDMAAFQNTEYELSGTGGSERVIGTRSSPNLFSVLGVEPVLGRTFQPEEDQPVHTLVVLSYGLWQRKYAGSPAVIGRRIELDRVPYTIIGVMKRDFSFPLRGTARNNQPAALWVPMAFTPHELQTPYGFYDSSVIARLKPYVTVAKAQAEADLLAQRMSQAYPANLMKLFGNPTLTTKVIPFKEEIVGQVGLLLGVLQAAVAIVLLIACVNVALLLLSRSSGRSREMAVREALGATRPRLIAQLVGESLVMAIPGGLLGLALASWSKATILKRLPTEVALPHNLSLDSRVLVFTIATTSLTAVVFGLVPALRVTRTDILSTLKEGGRSASFAQSHRNIQGVFVVAEFALALVLMIGAGLLWRSFSKLFTVNPGFRPKSVLSMSVPLPTRAYPYASDIRGYYRRAIAELDELPGVVSVSAATNLPLNGQHNLVSLEIEGRTGPNTGKLPAIQVTYVLGDYLKTMGIPLVRGRFVNPEDQQSTQPVIAISEGMAKMLFPDSDPLGKQVRVGELATIVGIVGDIHDGNLSMPPIPHVYKSYLQTKDQAIEGDANAFGLRALNIVMRVQGDPASYGPAVLRRLHDIDPSLAVVNLRPMQSDLKESIAPQRFNATLMGIYAGLALVLALVGIYGVLAYVVTEQTHEIGIRMALGAQREDVLWLFLRRGLRLSIIGTILGLSMAWVMTKTMASLLYCVSPSDPETFILVTLVLLTVASFASYIPARRAMNTDPMVALRYE